MGRMIRAIFVALLIATVAPGVPSLQGDEPARTPKASLNRTASTLKRAIDSLEQGDAESARAALNDRDADISKSDEQYVRGRAYFIENKVSSARRALQSAIKLKPRNADYHYWLGRVYESDGAHAMASSSFQRAFTLGLGTCDLHLHWATALAVADVLMGDVRQQRWTDQMESRPEIGSFAFDGIVARHVRGKSDIVIVAPRKSALYQIHMALKANPKRADATLLAGELWSRMNEPMLAVKHFRTAAKTLKGAALARCHEQWATACLALGRLDSYLDHTKAHMKLTGGIDAAKMAQCYDSAGREASARGLLKKQIKYLTFAVESETTPARLINLADALMVAQRHDDAHRYLAQAMEQRPTRAEQIQIKQRLARTTFLASPANSK